MDVVESDEAESDDNGDSVSQDEEVTSSEGDGEGSSDVDDVDASDSDQSVVDTGKWHKLNTSTNACVRLPFTVSSSGIQTGLSGANVPETELEFFLLFFTNELVKEITEHTNEYPHSKIPKLNLRPRSIWHKWQDVTEEEMKAYIGVVLNMAMNEKPGVFDYFSKGWIDHMPFFSDVFSRYRFLQIHWMLHVNSVAAGNTIKIDIMVKHVKSKSMEYFIQGQDTAIDETTIGFKGHASFRMYNPQKPTKWGLHVYTLADSATGYIVTFEPYYGKKPPSRCRERIFL